MEQARQDSNPDRRGWSSPCFAVTPRACGCGRPGSNGSLRDGVPVLFPLSYVRRRYARLESNQRPLPSHGSALRPLSYGRGRSLRQESNLHLGRTTGVCWPLTLRRLEVETAGVEPAPPRCKRGAHPHELHPRVSADGWSRTTTAVGQRGYGPSSSPVLSIRTRRGGRPGSNRYREDHDLECCRYTTATMSGDDRTRTGDLSPDKRALLPLSYAPEIARVGFEPTVSSS
jgi:hypothetical protein